jgi:hypothetical protein
MILNKIKFAVRKDGYETWFDAGKPLHHKTLEKCVRESGFTAKDFSPKDGGFSTYDKVYEVKFTFVDGGLQGGAIFYKGKSKFRHSEAIKIAHMANEEMSEKYVHFVKEVA